MLLLLLLLFGLVVICLCWLVFWLLVLFGYIVVFVWVFALFVYLCSVAVVVGCMRMLFCMSCVLFGVGYLVFIGPLMAAVAFVGVVAAVAVVFVADVIAGVCCCW